MHQGTIHCKVCISVLFLLLACMPSVPSKNVGSDQIAECFINPSLCDLSSFNKNIPLQKWDSLVERTVRLNAAKPGVFTALLRDSAGAEYTLGYATPSSIRSDTTYPLIIYLHGGTGSPLTTKGEKAYEMLRPLADTFSLFLASPSANRSTPWWSSGGMGRVLQTLRFMALHYPINPGKVFLAGVSDGATGCWAAANVIPSPFAGFMAISGFGGMLQGAAMPLVPSNIMQRPIYNVNAGKDRIYTINEVNMFLDWCIERGIRVERKEYPDELHGFDYRNREFGALANYIRAWSKPSDTRGIKWTAMPGFPNCADNLIGYTVDTSSAMHTLNAFWKQDTLDVNSEGLSEALLCFPFVKNEKIAVRINKKRPRFIKPLPQDASLSFRLMMHACFPVVPRSACFRIKF